jgi:hypothetical protein
LVSIGVRVWVGVWIRVWDRVRGCVWVRVGLGFAVGFGVWIRVWVGVKDWVRVRVRLWVTVRAPSPDAGAHSASSTVGRGSLVVLTPGVEPGPRDVKV